MDISLDDLDYKTYLFRIECAAADLTAMIQLMVHEPDTALVRARIRALMRISGDIHSSTSRLQNSVEEQVKNLGTPGTD